MTTIDIQYMRYDSPSTNSEQICYCQKKTVYVKLPRTISIHDIIVCGIKRPQMVWTNTSNDRVYIAANRYLD